MHLHPGVPPLPFARRVHFRIALLHAVSSSDSARVQDRRDHNRSRVDAQRSFPQVLLHSLENPRSQRMLFQSVPELAQVVSSTSRRLTTSASLFSKSARFQRESL